MKSLPPSNPTTDEHLLEKKRDHYDSISTNARRLLVQLTQQDGISIRKASKALQIKYSTGKTLIQQYKRTGRIDRIKQQRAKLPTQKHRVRKIIQKALSQERAAHDGLDMDSSDSKTINDDEEMKENEQEDENLSSTIKD